MSLPENEGLLSAPNGAGKKISFTENRQGSIVEALEDSTRRLMVLGARSARTPRTLERPLFSELEQIGRNEQGDYEWKETARWVKFEEQVEDGGDRWSKPFVATLPMHALSILRDLFDDDKRIELGQAVVNLEVENILRIEDIATLAVNSWVNNDLLPKDRAEAVRKAILAKHSHQRDDGRNKKKSVGKPPEDMGEKSVLPMMQALSGVRITMPDEDALEELANKEEDFVNLAFMKKLAQDCEAASVLVGGLDELDETIVAFFKLVNPIYITELTEVPIPTRFCVIVLGPSGNDELGNPKSELYHQIGRSMATAISDDLFREVAYMAKTKTDILHAFDEYVDAVTVLPPSQWDPSIRIEPPTITEKSKEDRKRKQSKETRSKALQTTESEQMAIEREKSGLVRTGRLFGGLVNDIKRKAPFYFSEFSDALHIQCLASFIFIYFAVLAPTITFGGLFGEATENRISVIESLVGGMIVGTAYGFLSGQPLTILGPTGPVLVFETIVYNMCKTYDWEYLGFRFWIGIWVAVILLILVATDASALVVFITRFTEENFATLIGVIFVKKAVEKALSIGKEFPLSPEGLKSAETLLSSCVCNPYDTPNGTKYECEYTYIDKNNATSTVTESALELDLPDCGAAVSNPGANIFMTSILLFTGTYLIATALKQFKATNYFSAGIRSLISDFAVIIALLLMTGIDFLLGVDTPKLKVPSTLEPTWSGRGWVIDPFGTNPWWTALVAIGPALFATILVFMDQQITVVIVNRKEHLLKKGCGYHLDLFIVASMIVVCSALGLPWCEASTVPSINHVKSLGKESGVSAPGEKPQFLGIREQRLTHILVFILIGLSVFMAPILGYVPMPVLFGVFLYMGVASLNGLQLVDRLSLFLMPKKYQPDLAYLRRVRLSRVHLFTGIQVACLATLWIIKAIKQTSILFPVMLVVMVGVRKLLDFVFTPTELKMLDDTFPDFKRQKYLNEEDKIQGSSDNSNGDDDDDDDDMTEAEMIAARQQRRRASLIGEDGGIRKRTSFRSSLKRQNTTTDIKEEEEEE